MFNFATTVASAAPSTAPAIFSLPPEILLSIGSQLDAKNIKHFSAVSQRLRATLLPLILKDISIGSMSKLAFLAEASPCLIDCIRNLTITLNMDFYDQWTRGDDAQPLASILQRAPFIQSLIFQASNSPYDTPWNRLNLRDDALRGISLGLESVPSHLLPTFERLSHLELQTISTSNLEILLSRAPNLVSLAVSLPDGLSDTEITALFSALRHVPALKELAVSIADWEPCSATNEMDHVREVLEVIARRLPLLEKLDLRTRSYDMVEGVLDFKPVEIDSLEFEDFAPIIPLFSNLRLLRLPLQSRSGDSTASSTAIAQRLPKLELISWMQSVAFQGKVDEYVIEQRRPEVLVTRTNQILAEEPTMAVATRGPRRGFALFETLFNAVVSPDKPGVLSDVAVTFTALMVVSSMIFSPLLVLFGC